MTLSFESVEIVEVTWKLPEFGKAMPSGPNSWLCDALDYHKVVFIGGRVPPAYPQSKSPPVRLTISVCKDQAIIPPESSRNITIPQWRLRFTVSSDKSQHTSPCCLRGKLLELKTSWDESTVVNEMTGGGDTGSIDLNEADHEVVLFGHTETGGYVQKNEGSLNIYFKLEVTCSLPASIGGDLMPGEFTELSNDFESLLKDHRIADVEIKVSKGEGKSFQCHKMILTARSPIFRAMFLSDMNTNSNVVEVDDILPKTMEHFLSFIYCGRFQDSSWIQALPELAFVSDKYDVESLRDLCDSHLIRSVTAENAMTLGRVADRHRLTNAAKDILEFIDEYAYAVNFDDYADTSNCDIKVSYSSAPSPRS